MYILTRALHVPFPTQAATTKHERSNHILRTKHLNMFKELERGSSAVATRLACRDTVMRRDATDTIRESVNGCSWLKLRAHDMNVDAWNQICGND